MNIWISGKKIITNWNANYVNYFKIHDQTKPYQHAVERVKQVVEWIQRAYQLFWDPCQIILWKCLSLYSESYLCDQSQFWTTVVIFGYLISLALIHLIKSSWIMSGVLYIWTVQPAMMCVLLITSLYKSTWKLFVGVGYSSYHFIGIIFVFYSS